MADRSSVTAQADLSSPLADDEDHAFRAVAPPLWVDGRPSSAAFRTSIPFSVFLKSGLVAGDIQQSGTEVVRLLDAGRLGGINPLSAVVGFNCGAARKIGFDTRLERTCDEHVSHANVYFDGGGALPSKSEARKLARLASRCVIREPVA